VGRLLADAVIPDQTSEGCGQSVVRLNFDSVASD
jgi:hypothetical protein